MNFMFSAIVIDENEVLEMKMDKDKKRAGFEEFE